MWDVRFKIGYALPRDIGNDRFNFGPSSTVIFETYKFCSSNLKLFLAEAAALFNNFKIGSEARLTVNSSKFLALVKSLLRIKSTTWRDFLGAILALLSITLMSIAFTS